MVFYLVHPDLLMNCSNQRKELFQIQEDLSCNNDGSFQYRGWACLCSASMWCAPKLRGWKETGDSHTLSPSDVYCARPFTNLVSFALQQLNEQITHEFLSLVKPLLPAPDPHLQLPVGKCVFMPRQFLFPRVEITDTCSIRYLCFTVLCTFYDG